MSHSRSGLHEWKAVDWRAQEGADRHRDAHHYRNPGKEEDHHRRNGLRIHEAKAPRVEALLFNHLGDLKMVRFE